MELEHSAQSTFIWKLKQELIAESKQLRNIKSEIRGDSIDYVLAPQSQSRLMKGKRKFRHRHIAYCLLRGKSYKQVEVSCVNEPDFELIGNIVGQYTPKEDIVAETV